VCKEEWFCQINFPDSKTRFKTEETPLFLLQPMKIDTYLFVFARSGRTEYCQDLQPHLRRRLCSKREKRSMKLFSSPQLEASQNARSGESQRNFSSAKLAKAARLSSCSLPLMLTNFDSL
jgi:hypothetical protein